MRLPLVLCVARTCNRSPDMVTAENRDSPLLFFCPVLKHSLYLIGLTTELPLFWNFWKLDMSGNLLAKVREKPPK